MADKKLNLKFGNEFRGPWNMTEKMSLFNPSIGFSSNQLGPYIINGSAKGNGDLKFMMGRGINDLNPLGYEIGVEMHPEKCAITPAIAYKLSDNI